MPIELAGNPRPLSPDELGGQGDSPIELEFPENCPSCGTPLHGATTCPNCEAVVNPVEQNDK